MTMDTTWGEFNELHSRQSGILLSLMNVHDSACQHLNPSRNVVILRIQGWEKNSS